MRDWLLGIAVFLIGMPYANSHGFFGYVGLIFFTIAAVAIFQTAYHSRWLKRWQREKPVREQQKRALREDRQRKQRDKAVAKEWKRDPVPTPTPAAIRAIVEKYYRRKASAPLRADHLQSILTVQESIFASATFDRTKLSPMQVRAAIEIITSSFIEGLLAFTAKVNPRILEAPSSQGVFSTYVSHQDLFGQYIEGDKWLKFELAPGQYDAIKALTEPFKAHRTTRHRLPI